MSHKSDAKVLEGDKEMSSEKKLKPCCACPETKKARDQWYVTVAKVRGVMRLASAWVHCAGSATYQVTDPEP